jgi:hypothetical protein
LEDAVNAVLLAAMLAVVPGGVAPEGKENVIAVQIEGSAERASPTFLKARVLATEMFAAAGVRLEWCQQAKKCVAWDDRIVVTLHPAAPSRLPASVRAEARAFQGTKLWIYLDRMPPMSNGNAYTYWAHVLVHEITHLVQVSDQHAASGVMKAHWNARDLADMRMTPLPFTAFDIRLLQAGVAHRRGRAAAFVTL